MIFLPPMSDFVMMIVENGGASNPIAYFNIKMERIRFYFGWRVSIILPGNVLGLILGYLYVPFDPGSIATHGKHEGDENKFTSSMGTQNYLLAPLQPDYNQAFVSV